MRKPRDMHLDLSNARVLSTLIHPIPRPAARPVPPGTWEIAIPRWRPATINELFHTGNHFSAARKKRIDRDIVAHYARAAGIPQAATKRRVSLEVTLAGRMKQVDPDSMWKSCLDALVACRMLVDDCPDHVELGPVVQVGGEEKRTVIILEDLTP